MPVEDYLGIEGFCVNIRCHQDIYEAIDRMHTQIIDNIGERDSSIPILEDIMMKLLDLPDVSP